jgi:hypothetical protein
MELRFATNIPLRSAHSNASYAGSRMFSPDSMKPRFWTEWRVPTHTVFRSMFPFRPFRFFTAGSIAMRGTGLHVEVLTAINDLISFAFNQSLLTIQFQQFQ